MRDETEPFTEVWYAMSDLPATGALHVRVRWAGFAVAAVREIDKKGRHHWHEMRGKALVPLAARPTAWQPLDAGRWRWPNGAMAPEPLAVQVVPRPSTIGMAYLATATAAEIGAAMEGDRELARAKRDEPEPEDKVQWWRDVTRLIYEPMGSITREQGEARIMRHLIVERSIPRDIKRFKSNAAVLADMKRSLADVYGDDVEVDWVPPLSAQPEDWRDFPVVMGWFAEVMPFRREMFIMRERMQSPPVSFEKIGDKIGRHPEYARQHYGLAITALVDAGNRPPRRARAKLAELQERNRLARLR